jgi:hypothetical protein
LYIEKRKNSIEKLESIFETLFYQIIPFGTKAEDFTRSPIGNPSLITPVMTHDCNISLDINNQSDLKNNYGVSSIDFSDKIGLDLCEIMNGLYDEQTNLLSIMDQTTQIEGACLFYKNQLVQNQLDDPYLQAVNRVCLLYDLFERDSSRAEKGIVEVVQIDNKGSLYQNIDLPHTILDDYDYFEYMVKNNRTGANDSFENEMFAGINFP